MCVCWICRGQFGKDSCIDRCGMWLIHFLLNQYVMVRINIIRVYSLICLMYRTHSPALTHFLSLSAAVRSYKTGYMKVMRSINTTTTFSRVEFVVRAFSNKNCSKRCCPGPTPSNSRCVRDACRAGGAEYPTDPIYKVFAGQKSKYVVS